jgi:hypothetical protein
VRFLDRDQLWVGTLVVGVYVAMFVLLTYLDDSFRRDTMRNAFILITHNPYVRSSVEEIKK